MFLPSRKRLSSHEINSPFMPLVIENSNDTRIYGTTLYNSFDRRVEHIAVFLFSSL